MLADGNPGLKPTLVLFPGALGDAVCFEPTLDALAAGGPVVLYARGAAASVARLFPARPVVRSLDAPEVAALFSPSGDVAGAKPDPAVDWLTGFGRIASFTGSGEPGARGRLEACGARVSAFPRRPEGVHLCDAFLRAATGEARATARAPRVDCPGAVGDDRTRSPDALPLLLIHPGAGAAARRAPFELLAGIAARWRRCGGDVGVAIGPADGGLAGAWVERGIRVVEPSDAVSLAETLAGATAFLGNDSGPSHLAAALGIPGVALFRASDPALFAPRADHFGWVRLDAGASVAERVWGALNRTVLDSPGGRH